MTVADELTAAAQVGRIVSGDTVRGPPDVMLLSSDLRPDHLKPKRWFFDLSEEGANFARVTGYYGILGLN